MDTRWRVVTFAAALAALRFAMGWPGAIALAALALFVVDDFAAWARGGDGLSGHAYRRARAAGPPRPAGPESDPAIAIDWRDDAGEAGRVEFHGRVCGEDGCDDAAN